MRKKHERILTDIFTDPIPSDINWKDIEGLFLALEAKIEQGAGSRVGIILNNKVAVFHRPHPEKETDKGAVKSVRRFLINAGI